MIIRPDTRISSLGLSKRTSNALQREGISNYGQLRLYDEYIHNYHDIRGLGIKCIDEISDLLANSELGSVNDFGKPSCAYSLSDYLKTIQPDERNRQMIIDYCNGGRSATLQVIGEKYGITRERVRQLNEKCYSRFGAALRDHLIRDDVVNKIDEAASGRTEINLVPRVDDVFSGSGAAWLLAYALPEKYKVLKFQHLNGDWFVKTEDNIEEMLGTIIDKLRYDSSPIPISYIVKVFGIPEEMLLSIDGIVENNGFVTMKSNQKATGNDKNTLITNYLLSINRPASINEIKKNTGLDDNQVRGAIQDKYNYVALGKSIYDLVDRDYSGYSVNRLAVNILTAADKPLKVDLIVNYIQRYRDMTESGITYNLLYADDVQQDKGLFFLKSWDDSKKKKSIGNNYLLTLDEAIFDVLYSTDGSTVMDVSTIKFNIENKYKDAVSNNQSTIIATLSKLVSDNMVKRVGINTGCYTKSGALSQDQIDERIATINAKYELGLFLRKNIDKEIEIRYQTIRKNSPNYWRKIIVVGQNGRYIFAKNTSTTNGIIKYLKEHVVEYRENSDQQVMNLTKLNAPQTKSRGWYLDVKDCVNRLSDEFTLQQAYKFVDELRKLHPENNNIEAKIRQQLQVMRDKGEIVFLDSGAYRKSCSSNKATGILVDSRLVPNKVYSNYDLMTIFKVSGQGGMRKSNKTNSLVLIAKHKPDNPYDDKWNNNVFEYTGMGLLGDQSIDYAQNKTLAESSRNGVTVHLFECFRNKEYIYRGIVELAGEPYYETQTDSIGFSRKVVKFPLKIREC